MFVSALTIVCCLVCFCQSVVGSCVCVYWAGFGSPMDLSTPKFRVCLYERCASVSVSKYHKVPVKRICHERG